MNEGSSDPVAPRIDDVPDRAALHVDDRPVAVAPIGSRRQAEHETCPHLR
jgi:hypothetical protein